MRIFAFNLHVYKKNLFDIYMMHLLYHKIFTSTFLYSKESLFELKVITLFFLLFILFFLMCKKEIIKENISLYLTSIQINSNDFVIYYWSESSKKVMNNEFLMWEHILYIIYLYLFSSLNYCYAYLQNISSDEFSGGENGWEIVRCKVLFFIYTYL